MENKMTVTGMTADRAKSLARSGVSPLSPDKEGMPFLFFLLGDDIDAVTFKSGYPKDIITVTADFYKWQDKKDLILTKDSEPAIVSLEKNLVNLVLVATYTAIRQELTEVLAGKKEADKCFLIPKSVNALDRLLAMVERVNKVMPIEGVSGTTQITATNVQVVNNPPPISPVDKERRDTEHSQMLALLAGKDR